MQVKWNFIPLFNSLQFNLVQCLWLTVQDLVTSIIPLAILDGLDRLCFMTFSHISLNSLSLWSLSTSSKDQQGPYDDVEMLWGRPEPVAQSIRGSDCGSKGMGFDPHLGQSKVRLFSLSILTDRIVLVVQSWFAGVSIISIM
jgi:hypothetical protein